MHKFLNSEENILHFTVMKGEKMNLHFHKDIELLFLLRGSIDLTIDEKIYHLLDEDCAIVNSSQKHGFDSSDESLVVCFHINYNKLQDIMNNHIVSFWCNSTIDDKAKYRNIKLLIKNILNNHLTADKKNILYEYSLFYNLLNELVANFEMDKEKKHITLNKKNKYDRIAEIIKYIDDNYDKQLSLNEIAEQQYLTIPYLSKMIKKKLGMKFLEYLTKIRLTHAVNDLIYTNETVTKIAFKNGFANTTSFNKAFKDGLGMQPTIYRKQFSVKSENKSQLENEHEDVFNDEEINEQLKLYFKDNKFNGINDDEICEDVIADTTVLESKYLNNHWNKMVNMGSAIDLLKFDMQKHILILKKELGFQYVRFWGIFSEDMNIEGLNNEYNFDNIDKIIEFLIGNNLKPFIELGPKPKVLHNAKYKDIFYKPYRKKVRTKEEQDHIIYEFIRHITNKYGVEEVDKWYFEFWRDDDIRILKGDTNRANTLIRKENEYFEYFENVYNIIRKFSPNAKIGGGGFNLKFSRYNISHTLKTWKECNIKPDFWSILIYPYDIYEDNEKEQIFISNDKNYMINILKDAGKCIEENDFQDVEFNITEWSSTISNRDYMNDSCFKAAYIVKNVIDSVNKVNILGYWVGSDVFGEFYDSNLLLNGQTGLLTKNGIYKPSYYAFIFLNLLANKVIQKGDNYIITTNRRNKYSIIAHNYKHFRYNYFLNFENNYLFEKQNNIFEDDKVKIIKFKLSNVQKGRYRVKISSVNKEHGSVLDEWIKMNTKKNIKLDEIEFLKDTCKPKVKIVYIESDNTDLNIEVRLLPQQISSIVIDLDYE